MKPRWLLAAVLAILIFASSANAFVGPYYPAGGWLPVGATFQWEHPDQGRDFVTNWRGTVQAPGKGCVVGFGSDNPFPNGFGPIFVLARIDSGPFRSSSPYYLGHTTAILHPGELNQVNNGGEWCFGFGTPLARADQGHPGDICPNLANCEGYRLTVNGGWVELGQQEPSGALGPYSDTGHWYDAVLLTKIPVPWGIFPKTVYQLPYGQRGSEYGTVRTWETANCKNPARREICKSTHWHLQLIRDRIWFVAHNQIIYGQWVPSKPRWGVNYLGARFHHIEFDLTS